MKSLLCAKVNSDRVWAQINAVMSGALCRRQKASLYNGLLCGLPTTSTGYFAQVWSFLFFYNGLSFFFGHKSLLLIGRERWMDSSSRACMWGVCVCVVVAREADVLNSWEKRRHIGFQGRVAHSWGDPAIEFAASFCVFDSRDGEREIPPHRQDTCKGI